MKMRTAAIGVLVLALMWLSMTALADATLYTNPSTYGHAFYDTSANQFTLYDDECDGNYNYGRFREVTIRPRSILGALTCVEAGVTRHRYGANT